MSRLLRPLTFAGLVVMAGLIGYGYKAMPPEPAPPAKSLAAPDQEGIRKIVRDYLLEHPEVLEEAMIILNSKRLAEERARARAAIGEHRGTLLSHSMSPVSGNPNGDVTLVEFFDYACGYCKRSLAAVLDLLRSDGQLRVVWKDLPVLGAASHFAARVSMAAERQGRYLEFHEALMGSRDGLSEDAVLAIAGRIGLDVERLRRDMADPAIKAYLDETHGLARELGINGTPAFVIGDTLVPGAVGAARLKELIAEARSGG
jgi:protein-disulfide isomerase